MKNIFYNHQDMIPLLVNAIKELNAKYESKIAAERIDMIDKMAFIYWYEHMNKNGFKMTSKQTQMYEQVRHEVMDYGYNYFENHGS